MKTINVILVIIIIILSVNSCKNYYGFERTELKQNYLYVDYLIKNADSLYFVFQDTSKVHKIKNKDERSLRFTSDLLQKNIKKGKFQDGYDFVDEDFYAVQDNSTKKILWYNHLIKIRSKYNKDIIWFEFNNDEPKTTWKLMMFYFCNNYNARKMSPEIPCERD